MTTATCKHLYDTESLLRTITTSGENTVEIRGVEYTVPQIPRFLSENEVRGFYHAVCYSPWIPARWGAIPHPTLRVEKKLKVRCYYSPIKQEIVMAPLTWSMTAPVILHEYAHHITHHLHGEVTHAHGEEFLTIYAQLLNDFVGGNCGELLQAIHNMDQ